MRAIERTLRARLPSPGGDPSVGRADSCVAGLGSVSARRAARCWAARATWGRWCSSPYMFADARLPAGLHLARPRYEVWV